MDKKLYKRLGKNKVIEMYNEAEYKAKKAIRLANEVKAENKKHMTEVKKQEGEIQILRSEIQILRSENKELKHQIIENDKKADESKNLSEEALDILNAVKTLKEQTETSKTEIDTKAKENIDEVLNLQVVKKAIYKSEDDSLYKIIGDSVDEAIQAGRARNKEYNERTERLERQIHNCDMIEKYLNLVRDDLDVIS